jgi:ribosomal protein S18 acetylase RimI-like enzyme
MSGEKAHTGLREIHPENKTDVKLISRMHLELLHWGPMAQLGRIFLEKFCYTVLMQDDLMKVELYEVEGKPAGFIAYTQYSFTFHRSAIKKHFFYVTYIVLISILRNPLIILDVLKAMRVMFQRRGEISIGQDPVAEILAIGVYPEYRTPKFIKNTGLRISHEMFQKAVTYFKQAGLHNMRLAVDSFNKATLLFYHSLGGRTEGLMNRAGDELVQIWFDFDQNMQDE